MSFISVYITFPTEVAAKKITSYLIQQRYVACANIFPITSAYWWKSAVQNEKEWVGIVKTSHAKWDALVTTVEDIHPYDVPCIMRQEVQANAAYEKWIEENVRDQPKEG
ncbi:MAG: divalent-cation tolerance protein CutA [Bacteroidota bacterium]